MTLSLAPTESDSFTALRSFLLAILPDGIEVVQAQDNRVPEPMPSDFVLMTPTRRDRIETNVDTFTDRAFIGSIAGNQMTITAVKIGKLSPGNQVTGAGVLPSTKVLSGPSDGGLGVYTVTPGAQTVASTILQAGGGQYMQPTKLTIQLDVHGPNSADNAQIISTMFRDDYAVSFFEELGPDPVPLYADDPKQLMFSNAEQQIENRWVIEAFLQTNQIVTAPQQFADNVEIGLIEVDTTYPAVPPPEE